MIWIPIRNYIGIDFEKLPCQCRSLLDDIGH